RPPRRPPTPLRPDTTLFRSEHRVHRRPHRRLSDQEPQQPQRQVRDLEAAHLDARTGLEGNGGPRERDREPLRPRARLLQLIAETVSDSSPQGILVCDKPQGLSSHAVVSRVRRWYVTKKVGHAGTLDPMATGVLVLGLGRGTKLLGYITGVSKTYLATIRLGSSTPTDDADSEPDSFARPEALAAVDTAS